MPVTLDRPCLDGFADVEQFVIEHDLTDSLFVAYDLLRELYPRATRIYVEPYTDPEDGSESVTLFVCGPSQGIEEGVKAYREWNSRICDALPLDDRFRILLVRIHEE